MKNDFEKSCKEEDRWKSWLATTIRHKYEVTTAYRQSSAVMGGWFYETFIWEYEGKERKQIGDVTLRIGHFDVVKWIIENNGFDRDKFDAEFD